MQEVHRQNHCERSRRWRMVSTSGQTVGLAMGLAIGLAMIAFPAAAQDSADTDERAAENADTTDRIAVTGTRRRGRTAADSNVPIDTISADEIISTGMTETA